MSRLDHLEFVGWLALVGLRFLCSMLFFSTHLQMLMIGQLVFSGSAAYLVKGFAPFAAGSGISEVKCILSGFWIKGYLGMSTLAIKSLTLVSLIMSHTYIVLT